MEEIHVWGDSLDRLQNTPTTLSAARQPLPEFHRRSVEAITLGELREGAG